MLDHDHDRNVFRLERNVASPSVSEWVGWRRVISGPKSRGVFIYEAPAWPSALLSIRPLHGEQVVWTDRATAKRRELTEKLGQFKEPKPSFVSPTKREPRDYQRQAVVALRAAGWRALLADEMGLGKTSTVLWAAHDAGVQKILVVCPVSVKFNWQREVYESLPSKWLPVVIDGTPKSRASQFANATNAMGAGPVAIIINYDLLRHLNDLQLGICCGFVSDGMLVLDESHYIKNSKSERGKLALGLSRHAKRCIAITGTPQRNMVDDLYSQVEAIRPGTWSSARDFQKRYVVTRLVQFGARKVQKPIGSKNLDELNAVMNTLQIRRRKADVSGLPPKVYTYPDLMLEGEQLKLYKSMRDFARVELERLMAPEGPSPSATMSVFDPRAKSAIEAALRCEQIAQGFVGGLPKPVMDRLDRAVLKGAEKIPGRPSELVFPHSPKLVWLTEAIVSVVGQGGAPLVFTRFNAPMFYLEAKLSELGLKVSILHGALSAQDKSDAVTTFQEGKKQVLLSQVTMAEGWNATVSQDVLFLGRDWSPAINAQAEDRAHRIGTKGTVNIQIPIVSNTVELAHHKRLVAKAADAAQVLDAMTIEELLEAL